MGAVGREKGGRRSEKGGRRKGEGEGRMEKRRREKGERDPPVPPLPFKSRGESGDLNINAYGQSGQGGCSSSTISPSKKWWEQSIHALEITLHLAWGRGSWSLSLSCICLLAMRMLIFVTFSLPPGVRGWLRRLVALPGLFCLPFFSIQAKTLSQEKHCALLTIQISLLLVYNRKRFHVYRTLPVDRLVISKLFLHQLRLFVKAQHFLTLGLLILPEDFVCPIRKS